MDNNYILHQIASKADYISEVARNAAYQGAEIGIVDSAKLRDILRQLEAIAEAVEEYHDWNTTEG